MGLVTTSDLVFVGVSNSFLPLGAERGVARCLGIFGVDLGFVVVPGGRPRRFLEGVSIVWSPLKGNVSRPLVVGRSSSSRPSLMSGRFLFSAILEILHADSRDASQESPFEDMELFDSHLRSGFGGSLGASSNRDFKLLR